MAGETRLVPVCAKAEGALPRRPTAPAAAPAIPTLPRKLRRLAEAIFRELLVLPLAFGESEASCLRGVLSMFTLLLEVARGLSRNTCPCALLLCTFESRVD